MKPRDKQNAERERQAKVLDNALARTSLIKDELASDVFPTVTGKASYVQALYSHKPGTPGPNDECRPPLEAPTLTLLERIKLRKEKMYHERVLALEAQRQGLITESKNLDKAEAALAGAAQKKRVTLSEALRNDDRLDAMPVEKVLEEFVQEGSLPGKPSTLEQFVASKQAGRVGANLASRQSSKAASGGTGTTGEEEEEDDGSDEGEGEKEGKGLNDGGQEGGEGKHKAEGGAATGKGGVGEEAGKGEREAEGKEEEEEDEVSGGGPPQQRSKAAGGSQPQSAAAAAAAAAHAKTQASKTAGMILKQLERFRAAKNQPGVTLDKLVHAIKRDIPEQEQELHDMKLKQAVVQTRLQWALKRPGTYQSDLPHTAKQKAVRVMCRQLAADIVDEALQQLSMRPSLHQVATEVQEWKARQMPALMGIARHLADAVLKDVVDELIADVSQQASGLHKAADQFAFDVLVEAVAYSQGKFDFTHDDVHARLRAMAKQEETAFETAVSERKAITLTRDKSRASMRASMHMSEAGSKSGRQGPLGLTSDPDEILGTRSGKSAKSMKLSSRSLNKRQGSVAAKSEGGGRSLRFRDEPDVLEGDDAGGELAGGPFFDDPEAEDHRSRRGGTEAGEEEDEDDEEDEEEDEEEDRAMGTTSMRQQYKEEQAVDDAFGTLDTQKPLLPQRRLKFGTTGEVPLTNDEGVVDESLIYVAHREFDDEKMSRDDKQLYVLGLKAMLQEMRKRRGDAPYGHTQALAIAWPRNVHLSRARVLAAQRMKPPLTAGPSVWKIWDENKSKIKFAARARPDHLRAAEVERAFWRKVTLKPFFLGAEKAGPLVYVRDKFAPITCMCASTNGHFMAIGTATSATAVFDLRNEPTNPWFEVLGDGELYQPGVFNRAKPNKPPIVALAWSTDSYQLASLDINSTLRMFWMRQWPGQVIKENDGPRRQPILPDLALSMGPMMMAISGKSPLQDEQLDEEEQNPMARQWCVAFHRAFNITGTQPALMVPQVTGDLLRVHTVVGDSLLPMPLPRSLVQPKALLNMQTVNFLMPPQNKNPDVRSQSIYRGHNSRIVFISFLSDSVTIITVDESGHVNLWPAHEAGRTGFGWFQPKATWTLPTQLRTWRAWGPMFPLWPRKPQTVGFTLFGWITTKPVDASAITFENFAADPSLHDSPGELKQLEEHPMGSFLLDSRVLWLVRYRLEGKDVKKGRVIREELHRPVSADAMGAVKPLVISSFEYPQGAFVRRSKQSISMTKFDYKVVSACLTHSQRDVLLWCRVAASSRDPDSFPFFSCHVLNLEAMKPLTPRIDIYDHSNGQAPPAYAVSPTVGILGSEYLFVGLGCGVVGVYSIATSQLVRELSLNLPTAPYFVSLQLFQIAAVSGISCANSGKTILAVVPPNSMHVHMLEVNDELGTLDKRGGGGAGAAGVRTSHGGAPPSPSSPPQQPQQQAGAAGVRTSQGGAPPLSPPPQQPQQPQVSGGSRTSQQGAPPSLPPLPPGLPPASPAQQPAQTEAGPAAQQAQQQPPQPRPSLAERASSVELPRISPAAAPPRQQSKKQ